MILGRYLLGAFGHTSALIDGQADYITINGFPRFPFLRCLPHRPTTRLLFFSRQKKLPPASIVHSSFQVVAMAGSSRSQLTIPQALRIAKNQQNGQVNTQASERLEEAKAGILRSIEAQPTSYIMTQVEFSVMNYFHQQLQNHSTVTQAIARFWKHYNPGGRGSGSNAGSSSNSTR